MDIEQMGSEFIANPSEVMLSWVEGRDLTERQLFDCGRAAMCMEVLTSMSTLKALDGMEHEYAMAYGVLEGLLMRVGMAERVLPMYMALSRWRREESRKRAYAVAYADDGVSVPDKDRALALEALADGQLPPERSDV